MQTEQTTSQSNKKAYTGLLVKEWGTVAELTQTGRSHRGRDAKGGSRMSRGR